MMKKLLEWLLVLEFIANKNTHPTLKYIFTLQSIILILSNNKKLVKSFLETSFNFGEYTEPAIKSLQN